MKALSDLEHDFLLRLSRGLHPGPVISREEDRMRQRVRKAGWAEVVMNPRRWQITPAGRALLEAE